MKGDSSFIQGLRFGVGFWVGIATILVLSVYATAGWGSLPSVSSGSSLTSDMWNDLVSQTNTLASSLNISSGNVWVGIAPTTKLDVNGDVNIRWALITSSALTTPGFVSTMPNDMSFAANWFVLGSVTPAMPIWLYFYELYGCYGQNNFTGWAVGTVVFASGSGEATPLNYFDNTNAGGGSCGYFRQGFLKVTTANSTVQLRLTTAYAGGLNSDQNPTANSYAVHFFRLY